jgi:hypothetical protein
MFTSPGVSGGEDETSHPRVRVTTFGGCYSFIHHHLALESHFPHLLTTHGSGEHETSPAHHVLGRPGA